MLCGIEAGDKPTRLTPPSTPGVTYKFLLRCRENKKLNTKGLQDRCPQKQVKVDSTSLSLPLFFSGTTDANFGDLQRENATVIQARNAAVAAVAAANVDDEHNNYSGLTLADYA